MRGGCGGINDFMWASRFVCAITDRGTIPHLLKGIPKARIIPTCPFVTGQPLEGRSVRLPGIVQNLNFISRADVGRTTKLCKGPSLAHNTIFSGDIVVEILVVHP